MIRSAPDESAAGRTGSEAVLLRLAKHAGLIFPTSRLGQVELAMERGMRRTRTDSARRYADLLAESRAERDRLVGELTVGESYFFRSPRQFEFIAREVLPGLRRRAGHPLRVWSAGCAEGQEVYSVAILLEQLGMLGRARILGTDISVARLASARLARYRPWSLRGVPPEITGEFFFERGRELELVPRIRSAVELRYLNLAEDRYPSAETGTAGMDLVLCRNVLIYLDPETTARVAERLMASLTADGWLLLAASDPPLGEYVDCESVPTGAGVAYHRVGRHPRPHPSRKGRDGDDAAAPGSAAEPRDAAVLPTWFDSGEPSPPPPEPGSGNAIRDASEPSKPSDPHAATAIREAYARRDYDRVIELAETRIGGGADEAEMWVAWVRALANQGRLEAAGRVCVRALERHRSDPELAHLHSVLLASAGRYRDSASAARRALYVDRQMVVAHLALGHALARSGEADAARRSYRNAERLLSAMPPQAAVAAGDGETAERLVQHARVRLRLLGAVA